MILSFNPKMKTILGLLSILCTAFYLVSLGDGGLGSGGLKCGFTTEFWRGEGGSRLEVVLVVFLRKMEKMNGDCQSLIWGFNLV
ncbi:hypothetical protein H5410_012566 [Solanum commersonii]|uniref:Uncharacterized protein n=1 Tax=Solanum commersonii TaxID=4109 RepID=A0A9J6ASJ8_SOLCO|nr:hypothetical protein H5410_012566 [Solanum commersonii]